MGKFLTVAAALLTLPAVLASCGSEGCTDNQTSVPLAGFYSYTNGQAITVGDISIGGIGAPNDSLIVDGESVGNVYLPFRPGRDETAFFFRYNGGNIADTVTFRYTTIPFFASEDCGAMYRYRITGVNHTHWLLDSVAVLDSMITNIDIQRLQLYFTTSEQ